jgi:chemotaxis protein methyltransferase CheR
MRDTECIAFLQWALPKLGFRWPGFRKVRGQVCKRVGRRLSELGLGGTKSYQEYLGAHPEEWSVLDGLCRITISRFFRDRGVYETLGSEVLPAILRQCESTAESAIEIWSAGCGAGEEPYSICLLHRLSEDPDLRQANLRILATDSDEHQLARAQIAVYPVGCTKDMPAEIRDAAFEPLDDDQLQLRDPYLEDVEFFLQDLRCGMPDGPFHLILCRNLAFTYFVEETQLEILDRLHDRLQPGGYLVVGAHEELPEGGPSLEALPHCPSILRPA